MSARSSGNRTGSLLSRNWQVGPRRNGTVILGIIGCVVGVIVLDLDSPVRYAEPSARAGNGPASGMSKSGRPHNLTKGNARAALKNTSEKRRDSDAGIRVIYTVFAGRRNRLLLQEPYWKEMVDLGAVDEVHLWDFCAKEYDRKHIYRLGEKYPSFIKILRPQDVPMTDFYWFDRNHSLPNALERFGDPSEGRARFSWPPNRGYIEYFQYYSRDSREHANDVIIKADDDIVWVNSTEVRPFAEYFWNRTDIFLLSASVLNQGLTAHYQQKHGAIPESLVGKLPLPRNGMGEFHDDANGALNLHKYFLASEENREKFYITEPKFYPFTFTINVNFVALRRRDLPIYMQLAQKKCREEDRYYDEGTMTWDAIKSGHKMGIYMPLVVAHATFGAQNIKTKDVLEEYVAYGRKERPEFYGDILDNWTYENK